MPRRIDDYTRRRIVYLHDKEHSKSNIRRTLIREGLSASYNNILHVISKYEETGKIEDKHRSGRKRSIPDRTEEIMESSLLANDKMTAADLQKKIQEETGSLISLSTIKKIRLTNTPSTVQPDLVKNAGVLKKVTKTVTKERAVTIPVQPAVRELLEGPISQSDEAAVLRGNHNKLVNHKNENLLRYGPLALDELEQNTEEGKTDPVKVEIDLEQELLLPPPISPLFHTPSQSEETPPARDDHDSLCQRVATLERLVAELQKQISTRPPSIFTSSTLSPSTVTSSPSPLRPSASVDRASSSNASNSFSTPVRSCGSDSPPTEENHFGPLKYIFEHKITSSKVPGAELVITEIRPDIVLSSLSEQGEPCGLARYLMRQIFTPYELLNCNVNGIKKNALDKARVSAIRKCIMEQFHVPFHIQKRVWRQCVKKMDTANRNAKRYLAIAVKS
ncbi:hypothetical protein BSL78_18825 [Apostichopus japonicus]|uniref:BEN domain-containing protein n=1 Tax=Stichopus japonicus TaxID=307972 RepID=A0A2G8K8H3_STIJA|nr:hypothetical protein BSL78_18825 [Apostichopus japonicus]